MITLLGHYLYLQNMEIVSKVYITQDANTSPNVLTIEDRYDTNALSLYILSKNSTSNLTIADPALKQNLSTYLAEYRLITDAVRIKDAFIINIGVNFDIIAQPNFNNRIILNNCINALNRLLSI